MSITLYGISIEINPSQLLQAKLVILTVPSFIIIDVSFGIVPLYLYATLPIYIKPSGWLFIQAVSSKAPKPMLVILSLIVIVFRFLHPKKALSPILVLLLGIVSEVSPVQYEKASKSMFVTLFGIFTEVKPVHPEKAKFPNRYHAIGNINRG